MSLLVSVCLVPLPAPQRLQEVVVPVVSNTDCRNTYSILTNNMICAGLTDGGKDSCQVCLLASPHIYNKCNDEDTAHRTP